MDARADAVSTRVARAGRGAVDARAMGTRGEIAREDAGAARGGWDGEARASASASASDEEGERTTRRVSSSASGSDREDEGGGVNVAYPMFLCDERHHVGAGGGGGRGRVGGGVGSVADERSDEDGECGFGVVPEYWRGSSGYDEDFSVRAHAVLDTTHDDATAE